MTGRIFWVVVKVASKDDCCGGIIVQGLVNRCSKLNKGCRKFNFLAGCREVNGKDNNCVMVWRGIIEGTKMWRIGFKNCSKGIDVVKPNNA